MPATTAPDPRISSFMGIAAHRFMTPAGPIAVFLHDLRGDDIERILSVLRREVEAQLGRSYAPRAPWRERP